MTFDGENITFSRVIQVTSNDRGSFEILAVLTFPLHFVSVGALNSDIMSQISARIDESAFSPCRNRMILILGLSRKQHKHLQGIGLKISQNA